MRCLTGDYAEAGDLLHRALGFCQDLGNRHGQANALNDLGHVLHLTGKHDEAARQLRRALALFRDIGDLQGEAEALNNMGALLDASSGPRGPGKGLTAYRRALSLARRVHSPLDEARALEGAARCQSRIPEAGPPPRPTSGGLSTSTDAWAPPRRRPSPVFRQSE
ncbi:tetratricopeptide repeat protein [Streptomyces sp. M19]